MFDEVKRELLRKLREFEDKSPKGSVDEPIIEMIQLINNHPNYVRCFKKYYTLYQTNDYD
jgi:tRNA(Phe) wybutosine-synthesizing methylase Tyw3